MPADPRKQVELLADAIAKTQDAVKRDTRARLSDALAKIQPVMSNAEAKKEIDELMTRPRCAGTRCSLKLLETAVGKRHADARDVPAPTGQVPRKKTSASTS